MLGRGERCICSNSGVKGQKIRLKRKILPSIRVSCNVKLNDFDVGVYFFNQGSPTLAFFFLDTGEILDRRKWGLRIRDLLGIPKRRVLRNT